MENRERESGIELLKIIAIILIIISHAAQDLCKDYFSSWNFHINLEHCTTNIQYLVLILFRHIGFLGNHIFFLSSAWFLCGKTKPRKGGKILHMWLDIWFISILCLLFFAILGVDISAKDVIKSIFPLTFNNNWYVAAYLIFYAIFPYLNQIIDKISQKELLTANIIGLFMYYGIGFFHTTFYSSLPVLFIVMYFCMAYVKLYLKDLSSKKGIYYILVLFGICGMTGVVLAANFVGFKVSYIGEKMLHWATMNNPFILLIAFSLFQIFRQKTFINVSINRIAGLSLLIYLFHENLIFKRYVRPLAFYYIYNSFGHQYVVLWVLLYSAVLTAGSALVSFLYRQTLQKLTFRLALYISEKITPLYNKWISVLMKIS